MILFLILFALYVAVFLLGWFLRPSPVGYCKWCEQVIHEPYCVHYETCQPYCEALSREIVRARARCREGQDGIDISA